MPPSGRITRHRAPGVRAVALALGALAYTACASTQVKIDYEHGADFARYHSFALQKGTIVAQGLVDTRNTLVRDRIDAALADGLRAKGFVAAADNPDLLVTYVAGARTRQELEHIDWAYPWGPFWVGPGYSDFWISEHEQGTLIIDFVEAATKKLVWRALVVAFDQPFSERRFIDAAVSKALAKYPPPAAPPAVGAGAQSLSVRL